MNTILMQFGDVTITPWQLVGFLGAFLFAGRWVVQIISSARVKTSVMPVSFWYMSITGNILLLVYFIFGVFDTVGIISNLPPLFIAGYNLYLVKRKVNMAYQEIQR